MGNGRFVFDYMGGLNVVQLAINMVRGVLAGDVVGHTISLPRLEFPDVREKYNYPEDGIHWCMADVLSILHDYHITHTAYGFTADTTWVNVKQKQSRWAETILLTAGVPIIAPTVDPKSVSWAAGRAGRLPAKWDDRDREPKEHTAPEWAEE